MFTQFDIHSFSCFYNGVRKNFAMYSDEPNSDLIPILII